MPSIPFGIQILVVALVLTAGVYDFRFRRIPNWLTLSGVLAGFSGNVLLFHMSGLTTATTGLALAMAIYLPLYLLRAMGAGDVKLMAAIGSIVGPYAWLGICLASAIVGGIM